MIESTRQHLTHGDLVLTALEQAHAADEALQPAAAAPVEHDDLFPRLQPRRSAHPTVLAEIRLHRRAVATIDKMVADHHFSSRTELITAALRRHLARSVEDSADRTE